VLRLGVNIDHIATVREARYRGRDHGEPDPLAAALLCEAAGAHGITAHLREDRRHIQDRDIRKLRGAIKTPLNLEMANATENQFFGRTCRNFGDRFAQQGPHGLQPFVGGGIVRNQLALLDEI